MQQDKTFLGTEPLGKLLLRLAIPTVTAQLCNMLYNVVDRIYIGRIPDVGSLALTGVGVCMPVIMLVSAFAALVSSGGAPRASICMGRGEYGRAEEILGNCFALQIAVSAVLTAVLLLWNEPILLAFGASENTIPYAVSYLRMYAVGTLFVQMALGMNGFITCQGFTRVSMQSALIGAGSNIILDPVFIFLFGMGVKGAALATILAQAIACCWAVCFLRGKKTFLRLKREHIKIKPKVVLPCVALGLAMFIMQASESAISVCFNATLLKYGGDIAVGAMTILTSCMQLAMLPLQGLGQGAQPIISYNYGAKNPQRVKDSFKLLLVISLGYSLVLWGAVMAFPQAFAGIFTPDPALLTFSAKALRIYLSGICLFGIQVACQMTFTSIGYARASITVAVVRKFVLLLPLIYLMPRLLPADPTRAVYLAEPIADLTAVAFTTILFVFQFKKAMGDMRRS